MGRDVLHRAAFFYAENGLVVSTNPDCLKGAFDTLTGLFDRVELRTNVGKTVGMIFLPCHAVVTR